MTKKQKTTLAVVLSAIIIGGAAGVYFFSNQTEPSAIVQEPVVEEEIPEVEDTPEIEDIPKIEEAEEKEIEIPQEYPLQEELVTEPVEEIHEDGTATLQEQPPVQDVPIEEKEPAPVAEQNDLPEGGEPGQTYVPGFGWVTPGKNGGTVADNSDIEMNGNKVGNMG